MVGFPALLSFVSTFSKELSFLFFVSLSSFDLVEDNFMLSFAECPVFFVGAKIVAFFDLASQHSYRHCSFL